MHGSRWCLRKLIERGPWQVFRTGGGQKSVVRIILERKNALEGPGWGQAEE
jgi:hypothetical protein